MKITFEGEMLRDIIDQMEDVLSAFAAWQAAAAKKPAVAPVEKPVEKPVETYAELLKKDLDRDPIEKPKRERTEKQKANDEKLRVRAAEKKAAGTMFKKETKAAPEPVQDAPEAQPFAEPEIDPAEMVKIREKTFEELRTAYANGHQNEVMELLSRFGNGAKTFRELPPESFVPIRKAIDLGALE